MGWQAFSEERVKLINEYIVSRLERLEQGISKQFLPMVDAMRYSLEGAGKRLRPMIMLTTAEYLGLEPRRVLPAACSLEFVHTYSLIHDDLPALDDDDTRRGKPSSHKKYGEAVAILAGDALLTEAFTQMLSLNKEVEFPSDNVIKAIEALACYSGVRGMVGGQFLDVTRSQEMIESLPELEFIHIHKTGALILASVMIPTFLTDVNDELRDQLKRYGEALGLAFQISDDILDSEANFRYSRGPRKKPKPNYTKLTAPGEIRDRLNGLIDTAISCIDDKREQGQALIDIAEFIRTRKN